MKHIYLLFVLITALVSTQARATLEIIITEGIDSARPIAVLPFKYNGINPMPERIADVVSFDLLVSGKFSPIDASQYPQLPSKDSEVDYAAWASTGVEAIVIGEIKETTIGRYEVNFQLVDVIRGQVTGGETQMLSGGKLVASEDHILAESTVEIAADQFRR